MMKRKFLFAAILLFSISTKLSAQSSKQKQTSKQIKAVEERVINIDFSNTAGKLNSMFNECVGAGRANEGLRADWQQQLA